MTQETIDTPHERMERDPIAEMRRRCLGEVRHTLQSVDYQLDIGAPIGHTAQSVGSVLVGMAAEAYAQVDTEQTAWCMGVLRKLPHIPRQMFVEGCMIGILTGDERASNTLHSALMEEKQHVMAVQEERSAVLPASSSALLSMFVRACEKHGLQADVWIDAYAPSTVAHWQLGMQHYKNLITDGHGDAEAYQENLDQKAAALLGGSFDDAFFYREAPFALQMAKDPGIRTRITWRFLHILNDQPHTIDALRPLLAVAELIGQDSPPDQYTLVRELEVASDARKRTLELRATKHEELVSLLRVYLPWKVSAEKRAGLSAEQCAHNMDKQLQKPLVLADASGNVHYATTSRREIMGSRDIALAEAAIGQACKGDFKSAHGFMSCMGDGYVRINALSTCVQYAANIEDVESMQPHDIAAEVYPDIALVIASAQARIAGSQATKAKRCMDIVASIPATHSRNLMAKYDQLKQLFTSFASNDPQTAVPLAKDIVATLRRNNAEYSMSDYLSDTLIQAGDHDELLYTYNKACNTPDASTRLLRLWALAKRLHP